MKIDAGSLSKCVEGGENVSGSKEVTPQRKELKFSKSIITRESTHKMNKHTVISDSADNAVPVSEDYANVLCEGVEKLNISSSPTRSKSENCKNSTESIKKINSEGGLVPRGPMGGKDTRYRPEDYCQNIDDGYKFGKKRYSGYEEPGYKFTRPLSFNDSMPIDSSFFLQSDLDVLDHFEKGPSFSNSSVMSYQVPVEDRSVCWENGNVNANCVLLPDQDDLEELLDKLGDDGTSMIVNPASHVQSLGRTPSTDDGIGLCDTPSFQGSEYSFSPESGIESPGSVDFPISPISQVATMSLNPMYNAQCRTTQQFVTNTSQHTSVLLDNTPIIGSDSQNPFISYVDQETIPNKYTPDNEVQLLQRGRTLTDFMNSSPATNVINSSLPLPASSSMMPNKYRNISGDPFLDSFFKENEDILSDIETAIAEELNGSNPNCMQQSKEGRGTSTTNSLQSLVTSNHHQKITTDGGNFPATEIDTVFEKLNNSVNYPKFNHFDTQSSTGNAVKDDIQDFIEIISTMTETPNFVGGLDQHQYPTLGNNPTLCNPKGHLEASGNLLNGVVKPSSNPLTLNHAVYSNDQTQGAYRDMLNALPVMSQPPVEIVQRRCLSQSLPPQNHTPFILSQAPVATAPQTVLIAPHAPHLPARNKPLPSQPFIPVASNTVIAASVNVPSPSNQVIFVPVTVIPRADSVTDNTKGKKATPARPPRKILPKAVDKATSKAPRIANDIATVGAVRPLCPTQKLDSTNGCLDVNSTKKLNIARRCVSNMTRADLQFKDVDGDTYLHVAVCRTDPHLVQAMLERIQRENLFDLINACNSKRQTPLYLAVAANQPIMVRLFVKYGADVNSMTEATLPDGRTEVKAAIHCAAAGCDAYLNTLRELIQAKDINLNLANSEGLTALHCAILEHGRRRGDGHSDSRGVIQLLIKAGADANVQDKRSGKTPLMYAIQSVDYCLVESMIKVIDQTQLHRMLRTQMFDGSTCARLASGLQLTTERDKENWQRISLFLTTATQYLTHNGQPSWNSK